MRKEDEYRDAVGVLATATETSSLPSDQLEAQAVEISRQFGVNMADVRQDVDEACKRLSAQGLDSPPLEKTVENGPQFNLVADPDMDSAGAELMSLAHRMAKHPDFSADADRVRRIGAWASFGSQSDLEKALINVVGTTISAMRDRGLTFHDDQPIASQFTAFFASNRIPSQLPEAAAEAAASLEIVARDQEMAAIVAKGIDMLLDTPEIAARYDSGALEIVRGVRDKLNAAAR